VPPQIKEIEEEVIRLSEEKEEKIKKEEYEQAGEIRILQKKEEQKLLKLKQKWQKERSEKKIYIDENEMQKLFQNGQKFR
jgi:ATP-dependent Clp protease ATP-binding subunit ClpC